MIILSIMFLYFGHLPTIDQKSMNGLFFSLFFKMGKSVIFYTFITGFLCD